MMSRSKYHAHKIETPDGKFDSKREYKRWVELKALADRGEITDLQRQVTYELLPAQYVNGKCVERAIKYIADFTYYYKGELVVEDSKGFRTDAFKIKRKLMLYFNNINVHEV